MENQKKEKNKKRIVLVVVLLLCCCTCVAVFVKKGIAKKSERSGVPVAVDAQTVDVDKEAAEEKETTEATDGKKDEKQPDKKPAVTETVASASGKKTESSADKPKTTEETSGQNSKTEATGTKKENTQAGQTKTTEAPAKQNTTESTKPKTTETVIPTTPQTTEATTEAPKTTEAQKQRVWVVDEPAWDETYPVYETRCRMICRKCGGYMYNQEDVDNHPCTATSWYDEYYDVQVGTETIHHDEVGHWEWQ